MAALYGVGVCLTEIAQFVNIERNILKREYKQMRSAVRSRSCSVVAKSARVAYKLWLKHYRNNVTDVLITSFLMAWFVCRITYISSLEDGIHALQWMTMPFHGGRMAGDPSRYLMGVVVLMVWVRSLDVLKLHHKLGPIFISLKKMLADVGSFMVLSAALVMACSVCFIKVYQHDPGSSALSHDPVFVCQQLRQTVPWLCSPPSTLQTAW